jgi:hypothetical protein
MPLSPRSFAMPRGVGSRPSEFCTRVGGQKSGQTPRSPLPPEGPCSPAVGAGKPPFPRLPEWQGHTPLCLKAPNRPRAFERKRASSGGNERLPLLFIPPPRRSCPGCPRSLCSAPSSGHQSPSTESSASCPPEYWVESLACSRS